MTAEVHILYDAVMICECGCDEWNIHVDKTGEFNAFTGVTCAECGTHHEMVIMVDHEEPIGDAGSNPR